MNERLKPPPKEYLGEDYKHAEGITPEFEETVRRGLNTTNEEAVQQADLHAWDVLPEQSKPRVVKRELEPSKLDPITEGYRQALADLNECQISQAELLKEHDQLWPSISQDVVRRVQAITPWGMKWDQLKNKPINFKDQPEVEIRTKIIKEYAREVAEMNQRLKEEILIEQRKRGEVE